MRAGVEAAAAGPACLWEEAEAYGDTLDTPVDLWWWLAFFHAGKVQDTAGGLPGREPFLHGTGARYRGGGRETPEGGRVQRCVGRCGEMPEGNANLSSNTRNPARNPATTHPASAPPRANPARQPRYRARCPRTHTTRAVKGRRAPSD